jgi:hypothetical protein
MALTLKGAWPGPALNLTVQGRYAYVAAGADGLVIVDVSDPASPTRVSGCSTLGSASAVVVLGNYAYLAVVGEGLLVISVSDPLNPQCVGRHNRDLFESTALAVSGDDAYLADAILFWGYMDLDIIDVRKPASPVSVGRYGIGGFDGGEIGLAVSGNHAFLAAGHAGLQVLDVSDPDEPVVVGGCGYPGTDIVRGVALSGNYAYVAKESRWNSATESEDGGGLEIIDVSNPASPVHMGCCEGDACRVAVSGNHAYLLAPPRWDELTQTYVEKGLLRVIDVSDPAHPALVGGYDTGGSVQGLAVVGNVVYVADREKGLLVLEVSLQPQLEIIDPKPFRFSVSGEPGLTVRVQRSSNLREWADWQAVILGEELVQLSDPDAANAVALFYRAVWLSQPGAQPGIALPRHQPAGRPSQDTELSALRGTVHRPGVTLEVENVLARVDLQPSVRDLPLPVHGFFRDAADREYALVIASSAQLDQAGWPCLKLDDHASPERYFSARPMRAGARAAAAGRFEVIHDDGVQWLVRLRHGDEVRALSELGFAIGRLSERPVVLAPAASLRATKLASGQFSTNAWVAAMMAGVSSDYLASLVSQLTGDEPAAAGGELRRIQSRETDSGSGLSKALAFTYEFMEALGLSPAYHPWSHDELSSSNVVGTQVGTVEPDQVVLISAHLDSTSYGTFAPGADDDASGCAAVLTAAAVLSQYRFERTVRYVLFTGEEQAGLGSEAYAAAAAAASDKIQAVLNLDTIGWDASGGPVLRLYTRSTNHPSYGSDLAIARLFTNVVAGYGLGLSPLLTPDSGFIYSDHASFWNHGYAAILAAEHYDGDFNPYYHTHNDLLCRLNFPYFTAFAGAAIGTVAHLAGPVEPRAFDVVRIVSGDWNVTKQKQNFGASVFHARHLAGAQETTDASDLTWASRHARTNAVWLTFATRPGDDDLATDSRPVDSESPFAGRLSASSSTGAPVSCTNQLRFVFLTPPDTNRLYAVRVAVNGQFTAQNADFLCVTNLLELVAAGGCLELPALANVPSGTIYGTCDLNVRFHH